jgi:steroid delta-isomerase-like uncharacterized protein
MHTENEAVALRWHGDIFERDQYDVLEEICTPDFVWHNDAFPPETRTPAGTKELARALRAGFSDYRLSHVEGIDTIVTDDKVVTFWRFVGTHDGEFMGTPATGKRVEFTGIDAFVMRDGKIAALYQEFNMLGFLRQIGALPEG